MVQIQFPRAEKAIFRDDRLPSLYYAGQISNEPDWIFPSHAHDDLSEIIYISEGEGSFRIGDEHYIAGKGDLLIYNRGVVHEERSNPQKPLVTYFCGVGDLALHGVEEGCILPAGACPVIQTGQYSKQVESLISNIFEEVNSQVLGFEHVCRHGLISLLILIIRITSSGGGGSVALKPGSIGLRIKEYIDKNYTRDIPLSEIANQLYISPHYLSHIFKEETGYSPISYMIRRRIGEAKRLLLTTGLSVQEISREVGYENSNYFSMVFKKIAGESPSRFRKKATPG